jgi:hypothetical protein
VIRRPFGRKLVVCTLFFAVCGGAKAALRKVCGMAPGRFSFSFQRSNVWLPQGAAWPVPPFLRYAKYYYAKARRQLK